MKQYKFKRFSVKCEKVNLPNKTKALMQFMVHNGGVIILAIYNKKIAVIEEYRPSIKKFILELPAGTLEKNEDPAIRAKKELKEETGLITNKVKLLFKSHPSPGVSNEMHYFFLAFPNKKEMQELEKHEVIKLKFLDNKKILQMIKTNKIINGPMIQALLFYNQYYLKAKKT